MNKYQEAMNCLWNAYDENKIYGIALCIILWKNQISINVISVCHGEYRRDFNHLRNDFIPDCVR